MKTYLFACCCILVINTSITSAQCLPQSNVIDPKSPDLSQVCRINKPFPVAYTYQREADVMWSKRIWRVIDMREKLNLPIYYPTEPKVGLRSLFDVLKCAVLEDSLTAFANPAFDDEFKNPMTKAEIRSVLIHWDSTHQTENVENPGEMIVSPMKTEITAGDVRQYWIKEDWFFDRQRSVMECRIIGICPLVEKKSESGEVVGLRPLFWIYFPEARSYLAKAAVFNRWNDAARMSYDELFVKRMFASYVYKESNVYDRTIAQYKTGLDALLESEDIKEDIFKYEEDLWHR
ncbi:MAG: gliding motility protein GldN [Bacteroidia bacterium]|nr:gliding motility protein GldN [Bacteroidia bacterium]